MKKTLAVFMVLIFCIVSSVGVSATNINSPYQALRRNLSDPDAETLALSLVRRMYEYAYFKEHSANFDPNKDLDGRIVCSDLYVSFSSDNVIIRTRRPFSFSGFMIEPNRRGDLDYYNDRKSRLVITCYTDTIQEVYGDVSFFRDHVKEAKKYQTTREQIKYINDLVCDCLEFDRKARGGSIMDIVKDGKGVCDDYTNLTSIFLDLLGIPNYSLSVVGDSETNSSHTWNCVYVDGSWKHLDVTWNDGSNRNKYFLLDEINQVEDHNWTKDCDEATIETIRKLALIVTDEYKKGVKESVYSEMDKIYNPEKNIDDTRKHIVPKYYAGVYKLSPDDILEMESLDAFVTRKDFCRMLCQTIESISGKPIQEILEEKQVSEKQISFLDTDDTSVIALAKLGIVSGVGDGYFNTNGWVNRVQAAVFVGRVAEKVFGVDTKSETVDFAKSGFRDTEDILNSWYKDEIAWALIHGVVREYISSWYNPNEYRTYDEALAIMNEMYAIFK